MSGIDDFTRTVIAESARDLALVDLTPDQRRIAQACDEIKALLLAKNKAYGSSAFKPLRVFSQASPVEQLLVRVDDKLSRLSRGSELPDESFAQTLDDLIGYLVLLKVARSAP